MLLCYLRFCLNFKWKKKYKSLDLNRKCVLDNNWLLKNQPNVAGRWLTPAPVRFEERRVLWKWPARGGFRLLTDFMLNVSSSLSVVPLFSLTRPGHEAILFVCVFHAWLISQQGGRPMRDDKKKKRKNIFRYFSCFTRFTRAASENRSDFLFTKKRYINF